MTCLSGIPALPALPLSWDLFNSNKPNTSVDAAVLELATASFCIPLSHVQLFARNEALVESLESVGMEIGEDQTAHSDDSITQTHRCFRPPQRLGSVSGDSSISSVTTGPHTPLRNDASVFSSSSTSSQSRLHPSPCSLAGASSTILTANA